MSPDSTSLKVKFYWLLQYAKEDKAPQTKTGLADFSHIDKLIGVAVSDEDIELEDIKICNGKDGHVIRSGEIIELSTSDPEHLPLPSWDLLEMQWILQRLISLSAVALAEDEVLNDDKPEGSGQIEGCELEFDESSEEWHDGSAVDDALRGRVNDWIDA